MPRYLIRPRDFRATPRRLHTLLRTQRTVVYNGHNRRTPDWTSDFFLSYRFPPEQVLSSDQEYSELHMFYCSNKSLQRQVLAADGIKIPDSYPSTKYIVRPLRHYAGSGYRVTEDDNDFDPAHEYCAPLFQKTSEYRAIYSKGQQILLLKKRIPEGLSHELPWNHANGSYFVTIDPEHANLRKTTYLGDLQRSPVVQKAHLLAVDILYRKPEPDKYEYAVCEINFCPSLTIPDNLEKISNHVHATFEAA